MNGIIYCRVSSKEQVEGTSLESQEAACRDYASARGITVVKSFVEQGESAKFADRTQLLALIDFCRSEKGKLQLLLVWKVDRFARNVADHYSVKSTLAKFGVQVVSVTEPIDANPEGRLMETMLAGFAQFDNDLRAMRTIQGMRRKIQDGIFPWGPPYGYLSSTVAGEKKTLPDKPDPQIFPLLQRAWNEFVGGAYSQAEMGRRMASWGLTGSHGKTFCPQSLHQLFTNFYYAGVLVDPWDGREYEGKHLPMVSRAVFAKVQQVIGRGERSVPHQKDRKEFPLRGLIRCEGCERYMTASLSRGRSRRYPYYFCQTKTCAQRRASHPAATLHDEFGNFLDTIAPKEGALELLGDLIIEDLNERRARFSTQKARCSERGRNLDRELQELIRMRSQDLITDQEFLAQKKTILNERALIGQRSPQETVTAAEIRENIQFISTPLRRLRATWAAFLPPFRRRFDRLVLPVGFVNDKYRTADLGLLFTALGGFVDQHSSVVPSASELSNRVNPEIVEEIRAFKDILNGVEEEKKEPKRRFEHSHRNRLLMRESNRHKTLDHHNETESCRKRMKDAA